MRRNVTGGTRKAQVVGVVRPAVGAHADVIDLQADRRSTAGCRAALGVASRHEPDDARRDVLRCAARLGTVVDRSDMLGIAARALERGGIDRNGDAAAFLPRLLAGLAQGDGDLELRPAIRLRRVRGGAAIEKGVDDRVDELIVVGIRATKVAERRACLSEASERLAAQVKANAVPAEVWIG